MSEKTAAVKCQTYAQKVINKSMADPSIGATFFWSGNSVPSRAKGKSLCAVIGGNKFFKNIASY